MRRLLLTLLVLSPLVLAAPANATIKAIWGPLELPNGRSAFPTYRDLGVDVLQMELTWANVATSKPESARDPDDPAYVWPEDVDHAIRRGQRAGIKVALLVRGTPGWANGGKSSEWVPRRAKSYKRFLVAASRRYPAVRRWMIWGEPDRDPNFKPLPHHEPKGPRKYARLLDAAYEGLKRVEPSDIVIGGMTFTSGHVYPGEFVRWMRLPNGKPPRLDEYGHNPFSARYPRLARDPLEPREPPIGGREEIRDISDVDTLQQELHHIYRRFERFRKRGPKLWLSEFTISSDRANRDFDFYVSRRQQAKWLTAAYRIAKQPYISGLGWVGLLDEAKDVERGLTTGLMEWEGKKKPAYRAYRQVP